MSQIILYTGGQSSGKSLRAEARALELSPRPVYVATARAAGMEDRIERHRARRGPAWTVIEEPLKLGGLDLTGRVVLVDCVTLWLTNLLFEGRGDVYAAAINEFERCISCEATYILVTNEVGLGGVADNELARTFADLQGRVNQYIAARADEVILVVAGIPVKIK